MPIDLLFTTAATGALLTLSGLAFAQRAPLLVRAVAMLGTAVGSLRVLGALTMLPAGAGTVSHWLAVPLVLGALWVSTEARRGVGAVVIAVAVAVELAPVGGMQVHWAVPWAWVWIAAVGLLCGSIPADLHDLRSLLREERSMALELVAGGVSHQLNNPLMSAISNLDYLRSHEDWPVSVALDETVSDVVDAVGQMSLTVRGFHEFAEDPSAEDGVVDLDAVVDTIARWAVQQGAPLQVSHAPGLPLVAGRQREILHTLTRLLLWEGADGDPHLAVARQGDLVLLELSATTRSPGAPSLEEPPLTLPALDLAIVQGVMSRSGVVVHTEGEGESLRYTLRFRVV